MNFNNESSVEFFAGYMTRLLNSYSYWEANQLTYRV
jgi:hypothetical protein